MGRIPLRFAIPGIDYSAHECGDRRNDQHRAVRTVASYCTSPSRTSISMRPPRWIRSEPDAEFNISSEILRWAPPSSPALLQLSKFQQALSKSADFQALPATPSVALLQHDPSPNPPSAALISSRSTALVIAQPGSSYTQPTLNTPLSSPASPLAKLSHDHATRRLFVTPRRTHLDDGSTHRNEKRSMGTFYASPGDAIRRRPSPQVSLAF